MAISVNQIDKEIAKELTLYNDNVTRRINDHAYHTTHKMTEQTKATAPVGKRRSHYKNNITFKEVPKKNGSVACLWYVKGSDYRLSHLLNNGHALRDGGRVAGTNFITKAEQVAVKDFEDGVIKILEQEGF